MTWVHLALIAIAAGLLLLTALALRTRRALAGKDEVIFNLRKQVEQHEQELATLEARLELLPSKQLMDGLTRSRDTFNRVYPELEMRLEELAKQQTAQAEKIAELKKAPSPPPAAPPADKSSRGEFFPSMNAPVVKEVMDCLDRGEDPVEIARKKGMQLGEIELIRALNKFNTKG